MSRFAVSMAVVVLISLSIPVAPARAGDEGTAPLPPLVILDPEERDRILIGGRRSVEATAVTLHEAQLLAAQDEFDALHYFLNLDFDEVNRRVSGSVSMTAKSLVPSLQTVVLDLHPVLTVSSVTRNGVPLAFSRPASRIEITLDAPVPAEQSFVLVVTYSGVPQAGEYIGWNKTFLPGTDGQMVWSLSEPTGARYWWPCKDRPDDKATVEEWYTVPWSWTATGNGVLLGTDMIGLSRRRFRFAATHPLTTYLVSIAATSYSSFSATYTPIAGGSMPIRYYVYPEQLTAATTSFSATPQMIAAYAQLFGEYPFVEDQYGMSAFPFGGAMEHTTNTSYGYTLINGGHNYDSIIAHELAHQWWGDSVSPRTWNDLWLNEGFASHSEALWAEHLGGASAYRSYMNSLWRSSFSGPLYPNSSFSTTVYNKGAWAQHMLRGVMGDAAFFGLLRGWYQSRKNGVGDTAEYLVAAEAAHGSSLAWFFQQWVYGQGMPTYQYGWTTANLGGGSYRTYVRIRQTQSSGQLFAMPVDLGLNLHSGSQVRRVWNASVDEDFTLDTTEPVISVAFDPSSWILKSVATTISLADADADGVPDRNDNCAALPNPGQANLDGDAAGDACDADDDGDLLADASDCAPLDGAQGTPEEVASLLLGSSGGGIADLSWSAAARADSYAIARGTLSMLAESYGECLADGLPGRTGSDPDLPAAGDGFVYLVRGVDSGCGGPGPAGYASSGSPRVVACP